MRRAACFAVLLSACGSTPAPDPQRDGGAKPAGATPAPVPDAQDAVKHNIVVITMDTTRADALTPYGGPDGLTPTASRLAAEGLTFTRAYTVTPLTIPAHASLHTGLLPPRHGVRDNGDHFLSAGAVTLAERLQSVGYQTMASVGAQVTSSHWGFGQGFDAYFDDMGEATTQKANRWRVERPGSQVIEDATGWLATRDPERPFFGWVHLFDAHTPYQPEDPTLAPGNPYLAEVGHVDRLVGQLLDTLSDAGQLDNTWVFLLSDHGEGLGAHGEQTHGVLLYDDTTRIPLLVRPPGGVKPAVIDVPVSIVDIAPSVLGLLDLPLPEPVDGVDLSPWLRDPGRDTEVLLQRGVYVESLYAWHHYGWAPQRAVVDPYHKLIDSTRPELYARADEGELEDIAAMNAPVVEALQGFVDKLAERLTPVVDASAEASLSPDALAQLEALGYVTSSTGADSDAAVPFRGGLEDPVSRLPVLKRLEAVRTNLQRGDLDTARAEAEAVLAREPGLEQVRGQLVSILLRQGEVDAALAIVAEADAKAPTSDTRFALARVHLAKGEIDAAVAALEDCLARDPTRRDAWITLLQVTVSTRNSVAFGKALQGASVQLGDDPLVTGFTGIQALMAGDSARAEPLLSAAATADPRLPVVHHALGTLAMQARDPAAAVEHFRRELKADGASLPARQGLIGALGSLGRWDEQLRVIEALRFRGLREPPLLHAHALALLNLSRVDEAMEQLSACEAIQPVFPECPALVARVYERTGRTDEAAAAQARAEAARAAFSQGAGMRPPGARP